MAEKRSRRTGIYLAVESLGALGDEVRTVAAATGIDAGHIIAHLLREYVSDPSRVRREIAAHVVTQLGLAESADSPALITRADDEEC